ncbi:MAG TPA: hypothetical protein VG204_15635 [Terriglobia bacterium]|nr:hypothetical protein [Terriglobia bacterium]
MPLPTITQVGNELQEANFGEILRSIAQGIADGQQALDLAAVKTLIVLSKTMVDIIPEVTEVVTAQPLTIPISGQPSVQVTGARVTANASDPVQMTALQAGMLPTFYQFTEATIQLKVSIQLRQSTQADAEGNLPIFAFASHVNFRTQNIYSYQVDASSSVTATLKPIPPNTRLLPSNILVNTLTGKQPSVTVSP